MKVKGFHFKPPKNKFHKKYKAMKITGYLTQCCNQIRNEDEVYGIISQSNMFSLFDSLKTVPPAQSQIHFCNECYQYQVIKQADLLIYKKYDFEGWTKKTKELAYLFKKMCIENNGNRIVNQDLTTVKKEVEILTKRSGSKLGKPNK